MDTLRVGSNIDAWCTKCKLVLAHTIEAIASNAIKRVQCNTCHGKHQFKATEVSIKSSRALISQPPKNKSRASDYARLLAGKDVKAALGYSASRHFIRGDVINHSQFGLGIVIEEKDMKKIEVLFESGPKILIHTRA
jgi:hypothetical protein